MARPARFRIPDIADLLRQMRYAPAAAKERQMVAAETFVRAIEPHQLYARSHVIHRITGYRPEQNASAQGEPSFVGEPLRADLVNFIVTLSGQLDLTPDHRGRSAVDIETLAERINVSPRTIQRYRRRGLVLHMVRFPRRGRRLACFEDAWLHFAERHAELVAQAGRFAQLNDSTRKSIIDEAEAMRRREGVTLNQAATRLADVHGRAVETIRAILQRHDSRSGSPIFTEHGPLTDRDLRVIERSRRIGIDVSTLAARFGKAPANMYRALHHRHGEQLRQLILTYNELPTFQLPDAEAIILGHPDVQHGNAPTTAHRTPPDAPGPSDDQSASPITTPVALQSDAMGMIDWLRGQRETDADWIEPVAAAYNLLKRRARQSIDQLPRWPTGRDVDAIDTDLRWAVRIKMRLMLHALPQAFRTIEMHLGRTLASEPSETIVRLLRAAVDVCGDTIELFDPSRRGPSPNLRRMAGYAMDRRLGREPTGVRGRAAARHAEHAVEIDDLFAHISVWQPLVDLPPYLQRRLDRLDASACELLLQRYGLDDAPPQRLSALARGHRTTVTQISRRVWQAEVALRRVR